MNKTFFRLIVTIIILAFAIHVVYTAANTLIVGGYWANAPIWLTAVVSLSPLVVIWAVLVGLSTIWRKRK